MESLPASLDKYHWHLHLISSVTTLRVSSHCESIQAKAKTWHPHEGGQQSLMTTDDVVRKTSNGCSMKCVRLVCVRGCTSAHATQTHAHEYACHTNTHARVQVGMLRILCDVVILMQHLSLWHVVFHLVNPILLSLYLNPFLLYATHRQANLINHPISVNVSLRMSLQNYTLMSHFDVSIGRIMLSQRCDLRHACSRAHIPGTALPGFLASDRQKHSSSSPWVRSASTFDATSQTHGHFSENEQTFIIGSDQGWVGTMVITISNDYDIKSKRHVSLAK